MPFWIFPSRFEMKRRLHMESMRKLQQLGARQAYQLRRDATRRQSHHLVLESPHHRITRTRDEGRSASLSAKCRDASAGRPSRRRRLPISVRNNARAGGPTSRGPGRPHPLNQVNENAHCTAHRAPHTCTETETPPPGVRLPLGSRQSVRWSRWLILT